MPHILGWISLHIQYIKSFKKYYKSLSYINHQYKYFFILSSHSSDINKNFLEMWDLRS